MPTGKLGPTGEFPEGKLNKHDEGELRMAIGINNNCVIIDFGTPTTWIGLPKKEAGELANILLARASKL